MVIASLGKTTLTLALPAARVWHTVHQHSRMAMGGAVIRKRIFPQRQPPVMSMADILPVYTSPHEILFMERQRHPRRGEEGNLPEVRRRAPAGHPVPAGGEGREGPG